MKARQRSQRPDKTVCSSTDRRQSTPGRTETLVGKSGSARATGSRKLATRNTSRAQSESADEAYVLKREPDGRYRIVGRCPRQQA
jgi:hypothetical protein